jgi:flagellar hook-basal body complex protein FliE
MPNPIPGLSAPKLGASAAGTAPGAITGGAGQPDFLQALQGAMDQVEQLHQDAQGKVAGMLDGSGEDVHSAMIAVEKAGLAFEMMVQVRNRIVQAYQTISQMNF